MTDLYPKNRPPAAPTVDISISLKTCVKSTLLSLSMLRGAQFSFGTWRSIVSIGTVPPSQFRRRPSGGQMKVGACRDRIVTDPSRAGSEGLFA